MPFVIKRIEPKNPKDNKPPYWLFVISIKTESTASNVCGGKISLINENNPSGKPSIGIYGINVKINNIKGKIAIKKLNAIPPARDVKAPLIIPIPYISRTSYKDIPCKPGIFICFPNFTNKFKIGTLDRFFSISFVI